MAFIWLRALVVLQTALGTHTSSTMDTYAAAIARLPTDAERGIGVQRLTNDPFHVRYCACRSNIQPETRPIVAALDPDEPGC